jgi:hypothetical protein
MVLLNETLIKKMGTHDAAFNLLQNDNVINNFGPLSIFISTQIT